MVEAPEQNMRPLRAGDLDRVVEIDQRIVGRSRRGFFEKRLSAAVDVPDDFVVVGVEDGGELVGFAFARISTGDFGFSAAHAVLDAIGVDPDRQTRGVGHMMMQGLDDRLRERGVREIRTQTDWRFHDLVRFLDREGFKTAPTHILERQTTTAF
jgi:GNAT superfamily N-acetyltransferase